MTPLRHLLWHSKSNLTVFLFRYCTCYSIYCIVFFFFFFNKRRDIRATLKAQHLFFLHSISKFNICMYKYAMLVQ